MLLKSLQKRWRTRHHHELFAWHSKHFYPFSQALTPGALAYLEACFGIAQQEVADVATDWHKRRYAYSHRIDGAEVNSSRMAYGVRTHPHEAFAAALPLLQEAQLPHDSSLLSHPGLTFCGLGWNLRADLWRATFLFKTPKDLPEALKIASTPTPPTPQKAKTPTTPTPHKTSTPTPPSSTHDKEGVLCLTFAPDQNVHYTRIMGIAPIFCMIPSPREESEQPQRLADFVHDDSLSPRWAGILPPHAQRILTRYQSIGQTPSTVIQHHPMDFTMYYP